MSRVSRTCKLNSLMIVVHVLQLIRDSTLLQDLQFPLAHMCLILMLILLVNVNVKELFLKLSFIVCMYFT